MAFGDSWREERSLYAISIFFISLLMLLLAYAIGAGLWKNPLLVDVSYLIPSYGAIVCGMYMIILIYYHPLMFNNKGSREDFARKIDSDARTWITSTASSLLLGYVCFSVLVDSHYLWIKILVAMVLHELSLQNALQECVYSVPLGSSARRVWKLSMRSFIGAAVVVGYVTYMSMTQS